MGNLGVVRRIVGRGVLQRYVTDDEVNTFSLMRENNQEIEGQIRIDELKIQDKEKSENE